MKISDIARLLDAHYLCGEEHAAREVSTAFAGDMLSDVLAQTSAPDVLLTGLLNPQVIRTAQMLDIACVVFVNGKLPAAAIATLAQEGGIAVLSTAAGMYPACGALLGGGLKSVG